MPLIKNQQATKLMTDAVVLNLGDLERQAEQLMADARAKAENILREAREEAQRRIDEAAEIGRKQGYEQGVEEGRRDGREAGRDEVSKTFQPQIEAMLSTWTDAVSHWEDRRKDMLLAAREDALALAAALARKIVHRTIELNPDLIIDQMQEALSMLLETSAATVCIHPEDRPLIQSVLPALIERIGTCEHVTLRDDPEITRGGCVVVSQGGRVDATIERQLDRITEALLPARHHQPPNDQSREDA